MNLLSLLSGKSKTLDISVDYEKDLPLPNGAAKVARHIPAGTGAVVLKVEDFDLRPMSVGTTYDEYYRAHSGDRLADGHVLNALMEYATESGFNTNAKATKRLQKLFPGFSGQIVFLGTSFISIESSECVPYLNVNTYQPALRYICPSKHKINYDFDVRACHIRG